MRRCGVHAGGCGGPLSPPGSETGNPTSWQEGDADPTEKLKSTGHNDRARSTRENGKRGGLSGFWELHVHKPRSPGRLCPHTPPGQGPLACSPGHTAGSHVQTGAQAASGPRAQVASERSTPHPAPKAPALSTFTVHVSRFPDTAR